MIYFTSDLHFFYRKPDLRVGDRRFENQKEKNEFLIRQWNSVVSGEDEVYILGDLSDGQAGETEQMIRQLAGKKYLIKGNNDHYLEDPAFDTSVFVWNKVYEELIYKEQKYILFHFPIEVWSGYRKDRIHLHGHLHRRYPVYEPIRRYEVGVDAHDGKPVSIDEITERLERLHNSSRQMPGLDR